VGAGRLLRAFITTMRLHLLHVRGQHSEVPLPRIRFSFGTTLSETVHTGHTIRCTSFEHALGWPAMEIFRAGIVYFHHSAADNTKTSKPHQIMAHVRGEYLLRIKNVLG